MPNETITALEQFMKYGPIGLAALMLILVVIAMLTRELTKLKAGLLAFFMVVGAGCFATALYFEYAQDNGGASIVLSVVPNDMNESGFPPPTIKVNGQLVEREGAMTINGTTILQVDVNSAIVALQQADQKAEEAVAAVSEVREDLETVSANAQQLELQVSVKETELAAATATIRQQEAALNEAQESGVALASRIQGLQAQIGRIDAEAIAPVNRDLNIIQREVLQFNNQLRMIQP
ncbi:MAG: hypothetical protein AAGF56_05535 [Pseudomonadota bacterium]